MYGSRRSQRSLQDDDELFFVMFADRIDPRDSIAAVTLEAHSADRVQNDTTITPNH